MKDGDVKNQHYVPRCYLRNFSKNDQLNLYDKIQKSTRINQNINKVASQNRFYDLTEEEIRLLQKEIKDIDKQFIEKYFSIEIEPNLKKSLDYIIEIYSDNIDETQPIIVEDFKANISLQITYQILRTRKFREDIKRNYPDIVSGLDNLINRNLLNVDKFSESMQKNILLEDSFITSISRRLYDMSWVINVNNTEIPYYTSDNPVVIFDAVTGRMDYSVIDTFNPKFIIYPCSPKLSITLIDKNILDFEKCGIGYLKTRHIFEVDFLNTLQFENAFRTVFFSSDTIRNIGLDYGKYGEECNEEVDLMLESMFDMIHTGNFDVKKIENINLRLNKILDGIYDIKNLE